MKLSVIITTYNAEEWLCKVLTGFSVQTEMDFEVLIADDGSTEKTAQVIEQFQSSFHYPIVHVWQQDLGFRKSRILNKALLKAQSDYLLFTDGDCIPRRDFVAVHLRHKQEGYFLSGGYFKLPMALSQIIAIEDIQTQRCFSITWLLSHGLPFSFKLTKLTSLRALAIFMNWITPTKRSWNGHNVSGFKRDIFEVNGFNEEMDYGGMDREIGERLFNKGLLSKQIRYTAVCLHLDHSRGYADPEKIKKNLQIRAYNKKHKVIRIPKGIDQLK